MTKLVLHWVILICISLCVRLLPHPPNFTAVFSLALYTGFRIRRTWIAYLVALLPMIVGDLFYGLHGAIPLVYSNVVFTSWMGRRISGQKRTTEIMALSLISAVTFFMTTNFGVWLHSGMYPLNWNGLVLCYVAAIPFFNYQLLSDLLFSLLFFYVMDRDPKEARIGRIHADEQSAASI